MTHHRPPDSLEVHRRHGGVTDSYVQDAMITQRKMELYAAQDKHRKNKRNAKYLSSTFLE